MVLEVWANHTLQGYITILSEKIRITRDGENKKKIKLN